MRHYVIYSTDMQYLNEYFHIAVEKKHCAKVLLACHHDAERPHVHAIVFHERSYDFILGLEIEFIDCGECKGSEIEVRCYLENGFHFVKPRYEILEISGYNP